MTEGSIFRNPWWVAALTTAAVAAVLAALDIALPQGGGLWNPFLVEPDTLDYFCEPGRAEALLRHHVDFYTNLGYLYCGVLMLAFAAQDRRRKAEGGFAVMHPLWSRWFGCAMLLTFAGSSFFHASLTRVAEAADLAGVYAAALLPGFFNLHRLWSLLRRRWLPAAPFLVAWSLTWLTASLLIFQLSSRAVVPAGLVLIGLTGFPLWLKVRPRRGWPWAAGSIGITVLAAAFFVMDIQKVGCDPHSLYQPHGAWHLLSATAAGAYYAFMRRLG